MRLDKYLKVSRIIKRRTVAKEACDSGRIDVNGKTAKAGYELKENDIINMRFGEKRYSYRVLKLLENVKKEEAQQMYEILAGDVIE